MDNLLTRYRNVTVLVAVLFAQVIGLAVQVKRSPDGESSRLIRVWAMNTVTPFEKGIVWLQNSVGNVWHNYIYLRGVRQENRDLKQEIEHLRLQQVRLTDDAEQARRLQALLGFKEQYIAQTVAAQVIGSSGTDQSRVVFIDRGSHDGIKRDMPVITADGVVGKVLAVSGSSAQVLLINDQTSGVGTILENSRLQGVLRGTATGGLRLEKILADEDVRPGEPLLTSGGDQIFPKGLAAGSVSVVSRTADSFLTIHVKPAANLSKLEEVLVITQREERTPVATQSGMRAADILAQRLPSVPDAPAVDPSKPAGQPAADGDAAAKPKPANGATSATGTPANRTSGTRTQPEAAPASRENKPQ